MFYTHILLGKHGLLSKIWIAAHWQKKLTKSNIFECNLEMAIQRILCPKMVISLRISGHLLLGVVRVYHRKTKYLLADCNEALLKMRITFCPGALDLSADNQEAAYNTITLLEEFHDFDVQLPELNRIDVVDHFTLNQSRVEDITMRDDYSRQLILHDGFGETDLLRQDFPKEHSFEVSTSGFLPEHSAITGNEDRGDFFTPDFFGDEGTATDFFGDSQLFMESGDLDIDVNKEVTFPVDLVEEQHLQASLDDSDQMPIANPATESNIALENNTTLLNDKNGFLLEPVDVTEMKKRRQTRRKRKLMVDDLKEISSSFFREQLADFSDTLSTPDIAPNTRSMMEWKMIGGVQWLLSQPTQPVINTDLLLLLTPFQRSGASKRPQQKPAEDGQDVLRLADEEQDLPEMEVAEMTDASSVYAEQTSEMPDMADPNQMVTCEGNSVQEESADLLVNSFPVYLPEDCMEQTESGQDNEELRWTKRTQEMLQALRRMNQSGSNSFNLQDLCKNNKRKQVSGKFYSLLVLKKQSAVRMVQSSPYSDIIAMPGLRFHSL